jgi:filamentous hemagglutinin family protein
MEGMRRSTGSVEHAIGKRLLSTQGNVEMLCPFNFGSSIEKPYRFLSRGSLLASGLWLSHLISPSPLLAQINPDGTLGAEQSIVTPSTVHGAPADLIQGGAIRGGNLFHSFTDFNVGNTQRVYFDNPGAVSRIIGRVTGNTTTSIDGTLGVLGNADLFLFNPNGIAFGPNAVLDLNGSFIATTAATMLFPGGLEFSATNPQIPSSLTIDLPVSLRFSSNPEGITLTDSNLSIQPGKTLTLIGGDIDLDDSNLRLAAGLIELGSLGANSLVSLLPYGSSGWQLNYSSSSTFQDITARNRSLIGSISFSGAAEVRIQGRNISLTEASQVDTSTYSASNGGNISVIATESLLLSGAINLGFGVRPGGLISQVNYNFGTPVTGTAGDINVRTRNLIIEEAAGIINDTFGEGNAGNIDIYASESIEIRGSSTPFVGTNSGISSQSTNIFSIANVGNAGDIAIITRRLNVNGGSAITARTTTGSQGGNINIEASERIDLVGSLINPAISVLQPSGISTQTEGSGNAGNLFISTSTLSIRDGGVISADTRDVGQAGNITIEVSGLTELIGTSPPVTASGGVFPSSIVASSSGTGNAGELDVETRNLTVIDGARLDARTVGNGNAGRLDLSVLEDIFISGNTPSGASASGIYYDTSGAGDAGDLEVSASNITLLNSGRISASTSGTGRGGIIDVEADNQLLVSGTSASGRRSGLYFDSSSSGDAQGISVSAFRLDLENGGQLTVDGTGTGSPGDIVVNSNVVTLANGSSIRATTSFADGGNILFNDQNLIFMGCCNNEITAEARNNANGGNIRFDFSGQGGFIVSPGPLLNNNDVVASADRGNGGQIMLANFLDFYNRGPANFVQLVQNRTPDSDFTARSITGEDGTIEINILNNLEAPELPSEFLGNDLEQSCTAGRQIAPAQEHTRSTFTITGQGGTAPDPSAPLESNAIRVPLTPLPSSDRNEPSTSTADEPLIQPARSPLSVIPCNP